MHKSIEKGIQLLLKVDEAVVKGLESFIPSIRTFAPSIADKIRQGGRIFLIGSGSSGRVAIDIAAKCGSRFPRIKELSSTVDRPCSDMRSKKDIRGMD